MRLWTASRRLRTSPSACCALPSIFVFREPSPLSIFVSVKRRSSQNLSMGRAMSFLLFGVRKQPTGDKDRAAYALVTFGLSYLPLCNTAVYWVLCLSVVLKDGTQINTAKGCIRS